MIPYKTEKNYRGDVTPCELSRVIDSMVTCHIKLKRITEVM